MPQPLPEWPPPVRIRLGMEFQRRCARNELDVRPGIEEQSGHINRGRAGAHNHHLPALKLGQVVVLVTMRYEFRIELGHALWHLREMGDPNCKNHSPDFDFLPVRHLQLESVSSTLNAGYELVFELWNHAFAECQSIFAECGELDGDSHVCVFNSALLAEFFQREFRFRIVNVRGKSIGFEHHAFRHVREPAVHRPAENAEWNSAAPKMRGNRKSVRPCSNNHGFSHGLWNSSLPALFVSCAAIGTRWKAKSPWGQLGTATSASARRRRQS